MRLARRAANRSMTAALPRRQRGEGGERAEKFCRMTSYENPPVRPWTVVLSCLNFEAAWCMGEPERA
eukprot:80963-Pyramimonas_sp.AAC.2